MQQSLAELSDSRVEGCLKIRCTSITATNPEVSVQHREAERIRKEFERSECKFRIILTFSTFATWI